MSGMDWERDEYRAALEEAKSVGVVECYRHHWQSDRRGGGVCVNCGETVSAGDL